MLIVGGGVQPLDAAVRLLTVDQTRVIMTKKETEFETDEHRAVSTALSEKWRNTVRPLAIVWPSAASLVSLLVKVRPDQMISIRTPDVYMFCQHCSRNTRCAMEYTIGNLLH